MVYINFVVADYLEEDGNLFYQVDSENPKNPIGLVVKEGRPSLPIDISLIEILQQTGQGIRHGYLPRADSKTAAQHDIPQDLYSDSRQKILLVDDTPMVLMVHSKALKDYDLLTAPTYEAAIDHLTTSGSEIAGLFLDHNLGNGKWGVDVRNYMLDQGLGHVPTQIVSGYSEIEHLYDGLNIAGFLFKPFELSELKPLADNMISSK